MTREISLNKEVFNKGNYQKNIDTTFKELGVKTIQEQIDEFIETQTKELSEENDSEGNFKDDDDHIIIFCPNTKII